jgi:hypothetical protein
MQSNAEVGEEIRNNHLKENTKQQYLSKWNTFFKWISKQQAYRHLITNEERKEVDLANVTGPIYTEFFGYICRKRNKNGETIEPVEYDSYQNVSGYRSAITYIHKQRSIEFNKQGHKAISEFLGGYVRKRGDMKRAGVIPMTEGKLPLNFQSYKMLARKTLDCNKDFELGIFGHLFLVLCWNLIARCNSVATLLFRHISWENDAMIVVFPTHKGDQEGRNALPKHVFANPDNPEICPILALAIFVFTIGHRRQGSRTGLFNSDDDEGAVEARFTKFLRSLIDDNEQALLDFGLEAQELGTHSFRKGIATFLCGMPGGPTAIAIYLRAGWSLGNVQQRYILAGDGGDQVCGRAATGLKITDPSFAALPPHFDLTNGPPLTVEQWDEVLPGYSSFYPNKFKPVLTYLLASLVYHRDFLQQRLHPSHPLFHQRVWRSGILVQLQSKVLCGRFINEVSGLEASGVPPHIVIANQLMKVEARLKAVEEDLLKRIEELPEALKRSIMENFVVNGTVPITRHDVEAIVNHIVNNSTSQLIAAFQALAQSTQTAQSGSVHGSVGGGMAQNGSLEGDTGRKYASFVWNGRFHPVPEGFEFPR